MLRGNRCRCCPLRVELSAPDAGDPAGRRRAHRHLPRRVPDRAAHAAGAARARERRAAARRDRPLRPRVRGAAARVPVRLHDLDPGARHVVGARAAGRDPHFQPHARAARSAAPPLRLSLHRLSRTRSAKRRSSCCAPPASPSRRRVRWWQRSASCAGNRSPSRPASPRPSTGPKRQRCLQVRARTWPDAFKRSIGVAIKDEEDLTQIAPRLDAIITGVAA